MYDKNTNKAILDNLLCGLYYHYQCYSGEGFARITTIIPYRMDWRTIAGTLYEMGLIVFSSNENNGCAAKLTNKGVNFCEHTSFTAPSIPLIHPEHM